MTAEDLDWRALTVRLEVVRTFARHLSVTELRTQIPPAHLFGPAHRRPGPHLYYLCHESPKSTHPYVEASLSLKRQALAKVDPPRDRQGRFRPTDLDLRFLDNLQLCGG